ncbi:sigma-70 family RNA polymerase sigma factor [Aquibacillus halophilus]|uniref:RNA polymerase sigma factor n=1 Tax=Aquibacillus halophilus TaxID=930132 RepID=A0A6A8DD67_9BACI|nr:sigma-70 family RNA polymerase sigma factor [Aquibacillus halophilus]MRH43635.1 sigma-70 family RNA polymerase sigma factor [Aquibacillus halophilus]
MDIIDRLKAQEESALIEIMDQYGSYLKRTAYLTLKDNQLAEEIVQDTFIKAFQKIDQLQEKQKLKSWLTTIAVNLCRSTLRKKKLQLLSIEEDYKQFESEPDQTPEEQMLKLLRFTNLSEAIMSLDYKYREVITLHYFNEYSINEIADITSSKENTIKSRLLRARQQLHELLEKEEIRIG